MNILPEKNIWLTLHQQGIQVRDTTDKQTWHRTQRGSPTQEKPLSIQEFESWQEQAILPPESHTMESQRTA